MLCAKCRKEFPLDALSTLEIANENFRQLANKPVGQSIPMYPKNELLEEMGLDSSMLFCKECKTALDLLLKTKTGR